MPKTKLSPEEKKVLAIRRKVDALLLDDADIVIDAVLDIPFWHPGVDPKKAYQRRSDDTDGQDMGIGVMFGSDSDAHFQVWSYNLDRKTGEPQYDDGHHRFRTHFGGGRSLRVRNALIMLARAIDLDNKERPDPK